jgi:hypothetical protein
MAVERGTQTVNKADRLEADTRALISVAATKRVVGLRGEQAKRSAPAAARRSLDFTSARPTYWPTQ